MNLLVGLVRIGPVGVFVYVWVRTLNVKETIFDLVTRQSA